MFEPVPKARADMTPGALYAATGEAGWIYYGQVTPEKRIGFFRFRSRETAASPDVLLAPAMTVITVGVQSITAALRSGLWKKLGRFPVAPAVAEPRPSVQWPAGTLTVTIWTADGCRDTRVEDPAIQDMEIMAGWDAEYHVAPRLTADFGQEPAKWHVGGPIWRERMIKQEMASRFPDAPWHALPKDWVSIESPPP